LAEFNARLARMSRSDQRRLLLDSILEKLLRGCEKTPAALVTRAFSAAAEGPLPEPLGQFVDGYVERPAEREAAEAVMRAVMADFGTRVFRHLLAAGVNRKACDTDLAQNRHDLIAAGHLLRELVNECHNTPVLPRTSGELLARIANALHDIYDSNSRPALFELDRRPASPGDTAGVECEGLLAAALEIVIRGGMKLAEAKGWLDREMREAGLVDEAGNPIRAERVASWRSNFRKGQGAKHARRLFDRKIEERKPLLVAPNGDLKRAACQDHARRLVGLLAKHYNRTVPPLLKR
jgi:hypothetical protein